MKKLAIIGASYLQVPLINKAKELGYETHVFAWAAGDVGEALADYFYPISIVEKEAILEKCKKIQPDGICTIASDLATVAVNYVATELGLPGNTMETMLKSTNKWEMRKTFAENGDPSPKSVCVSSFEECKNMNFEFPVIVKPTDRSGSRGVTKVESMDGLKSAIDTALECGFEKAVVVEEYASGLEYSVECITYNGQHHLLAITRKYTTEAPNFIEVGHLEPAPLSEEMASKVRDVVFHALDSLGVKNSASHSELKIDSNGRIRIIEIGARMGGDCIGSSLVELSTGIDFVKAVIDVAVGKEPEVQKTKNGYAIIRYIMSADDAKLLEEVKRDCADHLVEYEIEDDLTGEITDSSTRYGYFILADENGDVVKYLPQE